MGVWNINHFLSCLPIYNTIASVLAVKFIIWIEWTLTSIFGLWHALLLHMFGKYPSVGVLIGRGVPPLRSTEYPYCPRPQAPDNLPPQMITMGTQRLSEYVTRGRGSWQHLPETGDKLASPRQSPDRRGGREFRDARGRSAALCPPLFCHSSHLCLPNLLRCLPVF